MRVDQHTIELAGVPVFFRRADPELAGDPGDRAEPSAARAQPPGADPATTTLYLHGVPTSSDDWVPFLERTGGVAPDLIGFGRSGKGGHLEYTLESLTSFVENLIDNLRLGRLKLVLHDWGGAVGLRLAMRHPDRIDRIVLFNSVPLGPAFRWHRAARIWRTSVLGELAMGITTKRLLSRSLRDGATNPDAFPDPRVDAIWHQFDQGTQRAILRLYRSADEQQLAAAGAELHTLHQPALIIWGTHDPWLDAGLGEAIAQRLSNSTLENVDAGHWPWLDQRSLIERVAGFLSP